MAFLPQDPRKQLMLLIAILSAGAGALYYSYVYRPAGAELLELSDRVEDLQTQNRIAEARIGNLQALTDRLDAAEAQLEDLQRLVPENSEVPEIYEAIAAESQTLNLQLISIDPLDPVPADSSGSLMRQEWQMVVEGEYHAVGQFFTSVASFDRIVRPHIAEIVPSRQTPGGKQLVLASFGLETFVLGPGNLAPEGASPATGQGLTGGNGE